MICVHLVCQFLLQTIAEESLEWAGKIRRYVLCSLIDTECQGLVFSFIQNIPYPQVDESTVFSDNNEARTLAVVVGTMTKLQKI